MTTGDTAAERAPLDGAALAGALVRPGGFWRAVEVTTVTGSTNADLLEQAAYGAPEGSVLVAEAQTAGRGRMGRAWLSAPGAALMFSVLVSTVLFAWMLVHRFRVAWLEEQLEQRGLDTALADRRAEADRGVERAVGGVLP